MERFLTPNDVLRHAETLAQMVYLKDCEKRKKVILRKDKYLQDTTYTLKYLSTSLMLDEPMIFTNYMQWFGSLAYFLRFNLESFKHHFDVIHEVMDEQLPFDVSKKYHSILHQGQSRFEQAYQNVTEDSLDQDVFLKALLLMKTDQAYDVIQKEMAQGMSIQDVYLKILQPTLYKIGELWHQQKISVAKEHYMTAAIQNIIGRLYDKLFSNRKEAQYSITAVCAGDELHEIGMRMVADFFELSNWDSYFLGSNIPIQVVIDHLIETPTDVLAISATTSNNLIDVQRLIDAVKKHPLLDRMKILLGGRVFNQTPDLWKKMNADGHARDAEQAVLIATLLVGEKHL